FEHRLDIIQDQQTSMFAHEREQQVKLPVQIFWQICMSLLGEKLQAALQETLYRWCITQRTPEDIFERTLDLPCHHRCKRGLPNTSYPQDLHHAAAFFEHP